MSPRLGLILLLLAAPAAAQTVRVDVTPGHATNTIRPALALGAGIDRIGPEMANVIYEPEAVKEVLSAGYGTVSYRLNTELHVEDWHWNPKGTWSGKDRGYFVGDATPGEPIRASHGYRLPRRGFTRNEGTENNGFSRLTDGDLATFWKSNPYLEQLHWRGCPRAQWIVIDLEKLEAVNAIRIDWDKSSRAATRCSTGRARTPSSTRTRGSGATSRRARSWPTTRDRARRCWPSSR